jgi:hypothetical protein
MIGGLGNAETANNEWLWWLELAPQTWRSMLDVNARTCWQFWCPNTRLKFASRSLFSFSVSIGVLLSQLEVPVRGLFRIE